MQIKHVPLQLNVNLVNILILKKINAFPVLMVVFLVLMHKYAKRVELIL